MRLRLVLLALIFFPICLHAQLGCKKTSKDGQEITTCYHKNGKVSTRETWDINHREGNIEGFNAAGESLFTYQLRRFGGHASVEVKYYANGQVSKISYSTAPDGGIQWYRDSRSFDGAGKQTDFWKDEYPQSLTTFLPLQEEKTPQPKKEEKPAGVKSAAPYTTVYRLVNETRKTINISLKAVPNKWMQLSDHLLTVKPGQSLTADSLVLPQHFMEAHEAYLVRLAGAMKGVRLMQLMPDTASDTASRRVYTWYILRNR